MVRLGRLMYKNSTPYLTPQAWGATTFGVEIIEPLGWLKSFTIEKRSVDSPVLKGIKITIPEQSYDPIELDKHISLLEYQDRCSISILGLHNGIDAHS